MTGPVHTRTFKSGNSVAVRLPKGFALLAGMEVELEQVGDRIIIRLARDEAEAKRRWLEALDTLETLPSPGEIERREPIEFPDRAGL